MLESHLASSGLLGLNDTEANLRMKPADVAWPLRERNSLEISTRVEGTKHVQVGSDEEVDAMRTARAQGVSVNALMRRFGVHRGTVWAKTRLAQDV